MTTSSSYFDVPKYFLISQKSKVVFFLQLMMKNKLLISLFWKSTAMLILIRTADF